MHTSLSYTLYVYVYGKYIYTCARLRGSKARLQLRPMRAIIGAVRGEKESSTAFREYRSERREGESDK